MRYETHLKNGEVVQIKRWKYLLNWWSPIFGIATILITGALFFGNLNARIFDTSEQKYEVIKHAENEDIHLTTWNKERLVTHEQFDELRKYWDEQLKEIKDLIKENRTRINSK